MLGKIACVLLIFIFPLILFAAAFLGSAIDHNSILALVIGLTCILLSAFNFAFVMVYGYLDSQMEN